MLYTFGTKISWGSERGWEVRWSEAAPGEGDRGHLVHVSLPLPSPCTTPPTLVGQLLATKTGVKKPPMDWREQHPGSRFALQVNTGFFFPPRNCSTYRPE